MVSRETIALALYRLRATRGGRLGGYLTIVVLMGALGGLALGSVAGARRTQSSYPVLVASTHPSSLEVPTAVDNPAIGNGQGYNSTIVREIAGLPHVTAVANALGLDLEPLKPNGAPVNNAYLPIGSGNAQGNLGGESFTLDRFVVEKGRAANPKRLDEFMTLPETVAAYGWHLGEVIRMGVYTNAQTASPQFGSPTLKPYRIIKMRLTGIGEPVTNIVRDDVDFTSELGYFTPALTKQLLACCVNFDETSIVVDSPSHIASVERAILARAPKGYPLPISVGATSTITKAERAIKPISIALGVFGGITGLALLLIVSQIVGRQLRLQSEERAVLRGLGASPLATAVDSLVGIIGSIVVGSLLAVAVAIALSPIAPLGPVRPVYPDPGISFDWTVLALGFAAMLVILCAVAAGLAYVNAPERVRSLGGGEEERPSAASRLAAVLRLPAAAATGVRFALEPGSGRRAVPVRSAILGAVLASVVLITTVTFGASLDHLVSTPALYGWNWSYTRSRPAAGAEVATCRRRSRSRSSGTTPTSVRSPARPSRI